MEKRAAKTRRKATQGKSKATSELKEKAKQKTVASKTPARRRRRKAPRVPPPDSSVWPEQYRGKNWKSVYAILFARTCQLCTYSCPLPKSRQLLDKWRRATRLLLCTNHPNAGDGELREVLPIDTCRNFETKRWSSPRAKRDDAPASPPFDESDPSGRRIEALNEAGVSIRMDGRGRAFDNIFTERLWRSVKYEDVYLKDYEAVDEARAGLGAYFRFYNRIRPHQALGYRTPAEVHFRGGGENNNVTGVNKKEKEAKRKKMLLLQNSTLKN